MRKVATPGVPLGKLSYGNFPSGSHGKRVTRPRQFHFTIRIESADGRTWKVTVRDIEGAVYWMAAGFKNPNDAAVLARRNLAAVRAMSPADRDAMLAANELPHVTDKILQQLEQEDDHA